MGIHLDPFLAIFILSGILLVALYVFNRVQLDYREKGMLTRGVAFLQTGFFIVYALSSYLFLDSRFTKIATTGILLAVAVVLMIIGLTVVVLSMPNLGRRSFGAKVGQLHTTGIYKFSRNPQLIGGFLFIIGYSLLWPSWTGFLWAALWLPISHLMVRGEEEHLAAIFGKEYEEYCKRTPRYLGIPR